MFTEITEELQETQNHASMMIILHAGNAREKVMEALTLCEEKQFAEAEELLVNAKKDINEAHGIQTSIVQKEAKMEPYYYSMLFAHAQDTVMTVQSEYNIAKHIVSLVKRLTQ